MAQIINLTNNESTTFENHATIGRASRSSLSIKDRKLSRLHCEIIKVNNSFILVDLESHNGTKVNAQNVFEAFLQDGDIIEIGKSKVSFHIGRADN